MTGLNQALVGLRDGKRTNGMTTRQGTHRGQRIAWPQGASLDCARDSSDNLFNQTQVGLSI
jgi:hypothetical protein